MVPLASYQYGEKVTYVTRSGKALTDEDVRTRVPGRHPCERSISTQKGEDRIINRIEIDDD